MNNIPKILSTVKSSPFYNNVACLRIDKVFVDGTHIPNCVAYNKVQGWAFGKDTITKSWQAKVYGEVTVSLKG